MGHIKLGKPPVTREWRKVIELLHDSGRPISELAAAVERAADASLSQAADDPAFVEAFYRLLQIPAAVKSSNIQENLARLGIHVPLSPTLDDVLVGLDQALEVARRRLQRGATDFGLIAKASAISALKSLVHERAPTLWGASANDDLATLATFASPKGFGDLARRFFTNMLESHLNYFLDRETPRHIGVGRRLKSIGDLADFDLAVRRHCEETTLIMHRYAQDWLGKNRFHLGKELDRDDARDFASYAFAKIRTEMSARSVGQ